MELIETVTVGASGAASIDFAAIPQTYTDLVILVSSRTNYGSVADYIRVQVNSSGSSYTTSEIYSYQYSVYGSGNTSISTNVALKGATGANATSSTFGIGTVYIPNYTSSNPKIITIEAFGIHNDTTTGGSLVGGQWTGTSAISAVSISGLGSQVQYSTASLYGIKAGSGGATIS